MKRALIISLAVILLFAAASCGKAEPQSAEQTDSATAAEMTEEETAEKTEAETVAETEEETVYSDPLVFALNGDYVKPDKIKHSEEYQKIADLCYNDLIKKYERLAVIPREMLMENITDEDGVKHVRFTYYLGGVQTDCSFECSVYPENKIDAWKVRDTKYYREFYTAGIPEEAVTAITSILKKETTDCMKENFLTENERNGVDDLHFYWSVNENGACARTEYIAFTTDKTTKQFDCGNHSHIIGFVNIEVTDEGLKLSDFEPLPT